MVDSLYRVADSLYRVVDYLHRVVDSLYRVVDSLYRVVCVCYIFYDDKAMGTHITFESTGCSCPRIQLPSR